MRYIFPCQFGIHNVFTSKVDPRETAMPLKDYTLREKEIQELMSPLTSNGTLSKEEIARRTLHVPRRLRGSPVALINKLRKLHQKCSYMELLRHYCPVEVTTILLVSCLYLTFGRGCIYPQDRTGGKTHFSLAQQFLQPPKCNAIREMTLPNLNAWWKTPSALCVCAVKYHNRTSIAALAIVT